MEEVLKVINDNEFSQKGAFNLRQNGTSICHGDSEHIKIKKKMIEDAQAVVADRKIDLAAKKQELEGIDQETAKEMESLTEQSNAAEAKIDARLLAAYKRIRGNVRNGLAVVTVKRDACGGCYNRIPPQRQLDIRMSKKIIVCEYCGRILVSDQLDGEAAEQ